MNSLEQHKASHTPQAIQERLNNRSPHSYFKDFVYGAVDGSITTFAIVSGVVGASLSSGIVIILGIANLIADGFSMGVSNFLSTRMERQAKERAREEEEKHVEIHPEGEREEIRQIFSNKGFKGEALEHIVSVITADRKKWIDTMMRDELGLTLESPSSEWRAASVTFLAFILAGSIPLITYLLNWMKPGLFLHPFYGSVILTLVVFFIIGVLKGRYTNKKLLLSGFETVVVGGIAAAIASVIGLFLKGLIHL